MRSRRSDPARSSKSGAAAIENHQRGIRVLLSPLENFLQLAKKEIGLRGDCVAVRLISDKEMKRLNRTYRGKRRSTDVLSFPAEEARRGAPASLPVQVRRTSGRYLGDIAISPREARRNARSLGRILPEELKALILHGLLHLLGYDHETDQGEMERIEMRLRRRLGIA